MKRSKTKIRYFGLQWCHLQQYLISRHIIYKQQYKVYTHSTTQIMIIISRNLYIYGVVYFHNYEEVHSVSIKKYYANRKNALHVLHTVCWLCTIYIHLPKKLWFQHEINLSNIIHYLTCNH